MDTKSKMHMNLEGKLLIAMPGMEDPRFDGAVILICTHTPEGAMGLIINKPTPGLSFEALLKQLKIPCNQSERLIRVHFGGPVERSRGFVLHSSDYEADGTTMEIPGGYKMTATQDVLTALGAGEGPQTALLALGYAGWSEGQLEAEIMRNDWLTADAPSDLVFSEDDSAKWAAALRRMGVNPSALSGLSGRA
jgi:putative transcriptional regulator